jgi:hypothetical protein
MHQNVKKPVVEKIKRDKPDTSSASEQQVVDMVIGLLGEPLHYFGSTVRNVFSDKWRVNVWAQHYSSERSTPTHTIEHSFFLTIQNGEIIHSVPPIIQLDEGDGV